MLSRLIVESFAKLVEVALWLILLGALIYGWKIEGVFGALIGILLALIAETLTFGAVLVLQDIRNRVAAIEVAINKKA